MNKVIKDNKVAVIISGEYGGGFWTNGGSLYPESIFDPVLVALVLEKNYIEIYNYIKQNYPNIEVDHFWSKTQDGIPIVNYLTVNWIDQGAEFLILEYDGREYIEIKHEVEWIRA